MFKVGDIIKGKKGNKYTIMNEGMLEAEVIDLLGGSMCIKILKHKNNRYVSNQYWVHNHKDHFALISIKKEFSLTELQNGMVVEHRNGKRSIYKNNRFYGSTGFTICYDVSLNYTNELLKSDAPEYDIVRVYEDFEGFQGKGLIWERKDIDWSIVAVDTPIMVKVLSKDSVEIPRHFAKYEHGIIYVWANGCTSYTTEYMVSVFSARLKEDK